MNAWTEFSHYKSSNAWKAHWVKHSFSFDFFQLFRVLCSSSNGHTPVSSYNGNISNVLSTSSSSNDSPPFEGNANKCVTLQISNLDTTIEENDLKQLLINRLKPIASVISIYFESMSIAKIKLPSDHQARQVIAYLHRKKIGHKRITVSYTRESSTLDSSTLRCQVAGLLKVST